MNEKEIVVKYLKSVDELERYYNKKNQVIDDYVSIWKNLEKGDEAKQLRFVFNNEPNKMIKYIGVINYLNEVLLQTATNDKEKAALSSGTKAKFIKNYFETFYEFKKDDYLNDPDLSKDTKEFAKIFFDFKEIENDLYSWLNKTQKRVRYSDMNKTSLYI